MRNRLLAIAAIAGTMAAPIAAQAQTTITTGTAGSSTVVVGEHEGIVADQRPGGQYRMPEAEGFALPHVGEAARNGPDLGGLFRITVPAP